MVTKINFKSTFSLSKNQAKFWLQTAFMAVLVSLPTACVAQPNQVKAVAEREPQTLLEKENLISNRILSDVEALVKLGPRVTGTPVMDKASAYLIDEYRKAGYVTQVQTFTYPKFRDLGSNLSVNGGTIEGKALNGTIAGTLNAPLVAVPKVGRKADFAAVNVKGAIAIVRRGEIRFSEKAKNAVAAGAVGLVIANNNPSDLYGTLGDEVKIPVLGLSGQQGDSLIQQVQKSPLNASLEVNTQQSVVTGRNVIAHLEGVTQPTIILGGHYDSVSGSPGANDNASGTAVVLGIARSIAKTETARQAWFIAFDGEEDGLQGSRAFVNTAGSPFLSKVKAMLNFDMVGVNDQLGIGGSSSLTAFVQNIDPKVKNFGSLSGSSDHAAFASKGVPVLFFYRGHEPNYHSPNDKKVDPELLDKTTQAGLDIVKRLINTQ